MTAPASPRGPPPKAKDVGPLVVNPDDPAVLKHGILWKQGGSIKSWKKRYFYLYGRNNFRNIVLTYHKKPTDPAIDELPLEGAYIELPDPGIIINFRPRGQARVYPFKSTSDSAQELQEWYSALIEHTMRLEEMLFPGTTATVSTMHVFSTLQDRYGAKPGHIRALFAKLGVDYTGTSIARDAICKLLRFLPPLRKENPNNPGDSPTSNLDILATSRCGNTLSHWTRLLHQPWFWMYEDNLSVYRYLKNQEVGSFVVRFGRFDDVFVLTVKGQFEVLHFPILSTPAGYGLPNSATFPSLYGFLRNYVNSPLPSGISLSTFKVVALEEVSATGNKPAAPTKQHQQQKSTEQKAAKEHKKEKSKSKDMSSSSSSPTTAKKSKATKLPPPPPLEDLPPSLPSVPDMEPPPSLSTPDSHPTTLSTTVSLANMRLTTAFEVPASPAKSYTEPWKSPAVLAKADGWKTAKHGLCRRILLQKGLKVMAAQEMEQLSHVLRILCPEGPIRIAKCYALENARLVTLFEANNSFLEAKLKTYQSEAPKWANSDPTGARAETNQVLEHFSSKCAWNKDRALKILPLIYFASEMKLQTVEAEGFDKTQENPEGPYGAGYYLSRSIEEARVKTNNGPFIIAFAAPGRVYPTVEVPIPPNDAANSKKGRHSVGTTPATLWGKPCKDGYDSHFVRTCGSTKDDPGVGGVFSSNWTGSEWDQFVLFSMVQAVPRYLVYLEHAYS